MARRHIMESTFRLNLLNPQHAKINEVIKGLNPKIYKSKNQFLIEACELLTTMERMIFPPKRKRDMNSL